MLMLGSAQHGISKGLKYESNHQINLTACVASAPRRQVIWGVSPQQKTHLKLEEKT
jgi:hypothetical protein